MSRSKAVSRSVQPVALPIRATPIRRSRVARWRAVSLIAVHLLVALHIAHSCANPRTLAPLEPSESMSFSKEGLISAGLIFFGLTILSTLLLGRWFCGWACHVVALQDFSRWVLAKVGLRPAPIRSRILGLAPLVAFVYMFLVPLIDRGWRALTSNSAAGDLIGAWHLTTTSFWATFPGWLGALLTFVGCGFFAVYFLGAKGFCTNGCPYGAIFGAVDRFAPLRIRVTDACDGNGHCTAVCTSNVRVHEEVRRFGAVVDPGCMKCLDCVSVCPKEALFVGWPGDSRAPGENRGRKSSKMVRESAASCGWARSAIETVFVIAAMTLFVGFDLAFQFASHEIVVTALAAGVVLIARRLCRGPAATRRQLSLRDEIILGLGFLLFVGVFRGAGGLVAFLFSLGVGAVGAFLLLAAARMVLDRNVSIHGWRLKLARRWQPAGMAFAAALLVLAVATVPVARSQIASVLSLRALRVIAEYENGGMLAGQAARAEAAYRAEIALHPERPEAYLGLGMLLARGQRFADAEQVYQRALRQTTARGRILTNLALLSAVRGEMTAAERQLREAIQADQTLVEPRAALGDVLLATGRVADARRELAGALAIQPNHIPALLSDARAAAALGDFSAARECLDAVLRLRPNDADAVELRKALPAGP